MSSRAKQLQLFKRCLFRPKVALRCCQHRKSFFVGTATAGYLLTDDIGALAGCKNSKKMNMICMDYGNMFRYKGNKTTTVHYASEDKLAAIIKLIKNFVIKLCFEV